MSVVIAVAEQVYLKRLVTKIAVENKALVHTFDISTNQQQRFDDPV